MVSLKVLYSFVILIASASSEQTNSCIYQNVYFYGDLIRVSENIASLDECANLCQIDFNCKSANFLKVDEKCELMSAEVQTDPKLASDEFAAITDSVLISNRCRHDNVRQKRQSAINTKCGVAKVRTRESSTRIVGGFQSSPHSLPWTVSIQQYGIHRCGGALIKHDDSDESWFVLSAAHCFHRLYNGELSVKAGVNNLKDKSAKVVQVRGEDIFAHEQYDEETTVNDIALIKLSKPIKFDDHIQPICFPKMRETFKAKTKAVAAGWGSTSEGSSSSQYLMQVELEIIDTKVCNSSKYFYNGTLKMNEMICAGFEKGEKDACQGDSGGPLIIQQNTRYVLAGVVSFGEGCAQPFAPGIYARVSNYLPWILTTMNAHLAVETTTTLIPTTTKVTKSPKPTRRPKKPWNKPWWWHSKYSG